MAKITRGLRTVGKFLLNLLCVFLKALGPSTSNFTDEPYSVFNKYDYKRQFKDS